MIYLDNSATTKPRKSVVESFHQAALHYFGNPSSIHGLGQDGERLLRKSRQQAASILQVDEDEIIFTSGGTEGNNMAIKGTALAHQNRGKHIITTEIEHPSVLEACKSLEMLGFEVTYLPVNEEGRVSIDRLKDSVRHDTILVSIMHVNNEIGTIQPIREIGQILKDYPKIFYHVDFVQGFGKVPLSLKESKVDMATISGHKIHGLKGTGILYIRNGVKIFTLNHGGGQERGVRSGTENVPGIVSLVKAMRLQAEVQNEKSNHLHELKQFLTRELNKIEDVRINTPAEKSAPHIVNFSVPGLKPEVVIHALEENEIFISTKSACSSKSTDESLVLAACGREKEITTSGLRISMSYDNTIEELEVFLNKLKEVLQKLYEVMR
ncbi:cysteine desulfurase [Gracilibacillus halotolerans]|uniref:Cysteine desulfurase n=1 Tax=Gracilibacillus halotolerans TaxID=74386 RepID=A0A841RPZ3_9BACI|nr:cysteine desulfurase family protein [Gracilibacillus halotolerans]MBB6513932.1 cysteine desulfurase [Gracilibacillus halotolerans]